MLGYRANRDRAILKAGSEPLECEDQRTAGDSSTSRARGREKCSATTTRGLSDTLHEAERLRVRTSRSRRRHK